MVADVLAAAADANLKVMFISDEQVYGHTGEAWGGPMAVTGIAYHPIADLAVLSIEWLRTSEGPMPCMVAPLTSRIPEVGEPVLALGYAKLSAQLDGTTVKMGDTVTASSGLVEEVLPDGRDPGLINYPVVMAGFPSPGGLSGGPVIDSTGAIFGVMSKGYDAAPEFDMPWTSYVALIEPILDVAFPAVIDGEARNFTVRELAHRGFVPHDGTLLQPPPWVRALFEP